MPQLQKLGAKCSTHHVILVSNASTKPVHLCTESSFRCKTKDIASLVSMQSVAVAHGQKWSAQDLLHDMSCIFSNALHPLEVSGELSLAYVYCSGVPQSLKTARRAEVHLPEESKIKHNKPQRSPSTKAQQNSLPLCQQCHYGSSQVTACSEGFEAPTSWIFRASMAVKAFPAFICRCMFSAKS